MHKICSHTQRELFGRCPRKYFYQYIEGLDDPTGAPAQFSVLAVHPLVQAIYQDPSRSIDPKSYWKRYVDGVDDILMLHAGHCSLPVLASIVKVLVPLVQSDRDEGWDNAGIEITLHGGVPVTVRESEYRTRVDVLEERGEERKVVEVKFSAWPRRVPLEIDNQIVGHAACAGTQDVDVIEVLSEKPRGKGSKPRISVTRTPVHIQQDHIRLWQEETRQDMWALWSAWDFNTWPKRTMSCYDFNKPCHFLKLCEAGSMYQQLLGQYDKREIKHMEEYSA